MKQRVYSGTWLVLAIGMWCVAPVFAQPVNLGVSAFPLPDNPTVGSNWNWSVVVTNRGLATATDVRLRCFLPTNTTLLQRTSTVGGITVTGSVLHVYAPTVAAGTNFVLTYTLRPSIGGWLTNDFTVTANEVDADPADDQARVLGFAGPSGTSNSVETLRLPVKQLVADPVRGSIYALERTTVTNQTALYKMDGTTLQPQLLRVLPGIATHLRLSADARFLYAAVQNGRGMQRMDLTGVEADLVFETFNPASGFRYRFFDCEPDPNDARTIVVAVSIQTPTGNFYDTTAACFTEGLLQPKTVTFREYLSTPGNQAQLEMDANRGLAMLATDAYPNKIVEQLRLTATGVELISQYNYTGLAAGFELVADRMYSGFGEEVLADTGRRLRSLPTSQSGFGLIDYGLANDRLLLTQGGTSGRVQVFDRLTFARLGVITLTSPGTLDSSLVRDGGRLLLASTDGRLLVVTHSLIASPAAADLVVHFQLQPPQPEVNQPVQITITVTNLGPSNATTPAVTFESPANFSRTSVTPAAATSTGNGAFPYPLLWTATTLAPGQGRVFQVQGTFTRAGLMPLAAGAADSAQDPSPANNRLELNIPVSYSLAPGQSGRPALKAIDAIYDPVRQAILAIPTADDPLAGQLVAISAASGLVLSNWIIGGNPTALVLADDQQTLYVATEGGSNVTRLNLSSMQVQASFAAAPDAPTNTPAKAIKLAVNPGSADQLLARRSDGKLALYTSDTFQFASNYAGSDFVFFAPNRLITPKQSYSFDLYRYRLVGGTMESDGFGGPIQIQGLRTGLGFVFATDGRMVDPFNLNQTGTFAGFGPATVESSANLVYFPGANLGIGLQAFDLHTQSLVKDELFGSGFGQSVVDLFRAAGELFVTRYNSGDLIVMRSSTLPLASPADLAIAISAAGVWKAGLTCEWSVTVTNAGPNWAPGTRVDLRLPDGMYFVQANVPAFAATEPQASVLVGDLAPGQGALVTFQAVAQAAALSAELVVSTRSAASDPQLSNNVARLVQPIESSQVLDRVDFFPLPASDACLDPVSQRLYLACPQPSAGVTNVLVVLDPAHGVIERQLALPGRPGQLAVAPGGEFLYVSLNSADQVLRLTLPNLETNMLFTTLRDDVPLPRPDCDMAVLPDAPTSLAFSRFGGGSPSPAGVWIYDDGQPRPVSVPGGYDGITFIDRGASATTLLSLDYWTARFRTIDIGPTGLTAQAASGDAAGTAYLDFAVGGSNILIGTEIFNRSTFLRRAALTVPFASQASALSASGDRTVFAAGSNRAQNPIDFAGFRTDTLTPTGSARSGGLPVSIQKLVLWGTNGVAAFGDGYLFLGRLGLAGPPTQDSDGDGMLDDWESVNGLNPWVADAGDDLDLDGASNLTEYYAGTSPQSNDSMPRIQVIPIGNKLRLVFPCAGGRHYYVERALNLSTEPWTAVADAVSAGGLQISDQWISGTGQQYFRVRLTP